MTSQRPDKKNLSHSNEISELWRGQSLELLKELHILTRDGKLNADSRRKLKQVYHLVQFIEPLIKDLYQHHSDPVIIDVGAGKSYLGFILSDLVLRNYSGGKMISIESREDLVKKSADLATASGFDRMQFIDSTIEEATSRLQTTTPSVQMICALHACDTATDDAILLGLKHNVEKFVLVPCCQAELARQLDTSPPAEAVTEGLWRFPLHRREFGSHLTNVIRVLYLESLGFKVTVTELIGWEHSMKNELIIAERGPNAKGNERSANQLRALLAQTGVQPKLLLETEFDH